MDYSKLLIIGKVGRDAEMRYTPGGQAVTSFSVATNRTYSKDGQQVKEVLWVRVSCWGKLAEVCNQYVKKGMEVFVEGRLTPDAQGNPRTYDSNGTTKASFEMVAETVKFGAKNESAQPAAAPANEEEWPF